MKFREHKQLLKLKLKFLDIQEQLALAKISYQVLEYNEDIKTLINWQNACLYNFQQKKNNILSQLVR